MSVGKTKTATRYKSEERPLTELKLWDRNPRSINKDRFEELKTRLQRQGQIKPLLITQDGTVIGGNMRLRAMQELGWDNVWVSVTEAQTDREVFDLALTDNEEFGYYEQEQVAELALELGLSSLELKSYALSLGAPTTLDLLVDKFGPEVEEDDAPAVDDDNPPASKLGEIYQLGKHRLMCGNATNTEDVAALAGGVTVDLYLTDPPYNVEYVGKTKDALTIQNDKQGDAAFLQFLTDAFEAAGAVMKAGASFYIWHADSEGYNFRAAVRNVGWLLKQNLVWNKNSMVLGRQDYQWKHEPCLYGWKDGASHSWYADRKQTTVLTFDRPSRSEDHPTMKPVALIAYQIKNSSKSDDVVLDSFLGSGSTLIACEQTGRVCYGLELDPKYCDVIRKRYANLIGETERWQEVTPNIQAVALQR